MHVCVCVCVCVCVMLLARSRYDKDLPFSRHAIRLRAFSSRPGFLLRGLSTLSLRVHIDAGICRWKRGTSNDVVSLCFTVARCLSVTVTVCIGCVAGFPAPVQRCAAEFRPVAVREDAEQ